MRVAVVTETFLPSVNGVTTSVQRVLEHLGRRGHDAAVFCPGPAPARYAGFDVFTMPAVHYRGFRAAVPTRRTTRLLLDWAPDVVHAAAPFGIGAQALSLARRHEIASVAVFQTDVARYAGSYGLSLTTNAAWRWIRAVHEKADLTLAPASAAIADLRRVGVHNVARWGRGVDAITYHPNRRRRPAVQRLRAALAPRDQVLVGYVGRLAPEKKVEYLSAVTQVSGARLVVVGDGPSRVDLQRNLVGTDAVLLGALSGDDLADAYAALDVFVHTGTQETFGQTLQEAMASGLPVIAPAVGGPLDIVHPGRTGILVTPHSGRAVAEATTALVRDPSLRARMGEAGRRDVLPRSWERLGDDLIGHYRQVLAARVPQPA
ncbi:glycosyltransferase family 4 protein [Pseudactinotalea sp. Z1748]|uniref:glycosyltransferase family 4 protein n=1 Tax=Pseudactinotalea sp. Z1748 TaxID=3413027 RepID=UPI003C7E24AE